jgi:phenylalanyl-tRNA synthetase beta chain
MKVTHNWLKQYVDFNWSPEELAERLTMLGLEVEGIQKLAGEFEGIVVGQVVTKDKHPNADKLTVCRVHDGRGERQIVCGATNFTPGDKVALILPGATLPAKPADQPFTIKVGKIRGVESHGMMCSPKELGLADDAQGLLILREDAPVGQPFAEYLGRAAGDVVYDLEVTPNRPDLNSVIGIAREIAAVTGVALRWPEAGGQRPEASGQRAEGRCQDLVAVRIEAPDLCPRYVARVVRGVKVGPSPDWLRVALEKVGLRSINNVVDATNYVMLETGQPLHAFDYHLIARESRAGFQLGPANAEMGAGRQDACPTIVVRRAQEGELFVTLDGQKRTLTREMLLIADPQKGIALAGVMGGQNTGIHERTVDVLLESACFKPTNIRRTSKALGLRTDASYRFERGADIGITEWASRRCAQLMLETAGGQLAEGAVDAYPSPAPAREIALRHRRTSELLGVEIPVDQQIELLHRLGLEIVVGPGIAPFTGVRLPHTTTFRVPTWRVDLQREIDLIEEVERLHGLEKVPATPPRATLGSNPFDGTHDELAEARRLLTSLGLNEAQGQTLISDAAAKLAAPEERLVRLANPLSSDMNALRPSLLPGLLDSLRHNLAHKNEEVALFETGRVFAQVHGQPSEERRVAIALTGPRNPAFWAGGDRGVRFDVFDLKGLVEEFLEQFGVRGVSYARRAESTALFLESAAINLGGKLPLGELGQVLPSLGKRYDLRDPVFLAELNLDLLLARRNTEKSFKPLPAFPAIRRDVAMFVPEATTHEAVLQAVKQARPANLQSVELFDLFRGPSVPTGHKSLAYAFTYRHAERTLTDAEVNAAHEKLVAHLKQSLQVVVREGQ